MLHVHHATCTPCQYRTQHYTQAGRTKAPFIVLSGFPHIALMDVFYYYTYSNSMERGTYNYTHRLDVNVVLPKQAGGCCGLVQTLDVVPGLLGTGLGLTILHTSHITHHVHITYTHTTLNSQLGKRYTSNTTLSV